MNKIKIQKKNRKENQFQKEKIEHPSFTKKQVEQIVIDHNKPKPIFKGLSQLEAIKIQKTEKQLGRKTHAVKKSFNRYDIYRTD